MGEPVRPCVLIPHYAHHRQIGPVLAGLAPLGLPVLVIDDGSPPESRAALAAAVAALPWVDLVLEPRNRGKGAAVMAGLRRAADRGFTHAVQVDADGQHRVADIPRFLACAATEPGALVSGEPVFDDSAPGARRYGRRISQFWTHLETWSTDIRDAMCGFRVYPVAATLAAVGRRPPGRGMEFDAEVLVRAHWAGIPLRFVPTPVVYPPDGLSHFRMVRDNVRISAMHTRLVCGMLWRLPLLVERRWRRARA